MLKTSRVNWYHSQRETNHPKRMRIVLNDSPWFSHASHPLLKRYSCISHPKPLKNAARNAQLLFCPDPTATLLCAKTPLGKRCFAFLFSFKNAYSAPLLCQACSKYRVHSNEHTSLCPHRVFLLVGKTNKYKYVNKMSGSVMNKSK